MVLNAGSILAIAVTGQQTIINVVPPMITSRRTIIAVTRHTLLASTSDSSSLPASLSSPREPFVHVQQNTIALEPVQLLIIFTLYKYQASPFFWHDSVSLFIISLERL